jgi:hypothetical protein
MSAASEFDPTGAPRLGPMTASVRRPMLLIIAAVAIAIGACGPAGDQGGSTSRSSGSTARVASATTESKRSPDLTSAPSAAASDTVSQTDTAWGRIWDAVPAWFPRFPGSAPADDASATASSARYAVNGSDPETIAAWLQAGMETATFSTQDLSGPLEDGSFTLDSVGDAGCRIQTTIAPLGSLTFVSVLYGADCPIR